MKYFTCSITILAVLVLVLIKDAYAYMDPGTGSYIFQLMMAVLLTAGFTIKVYWRKIKAFFVSRFFKRSQDEKDDN